MATVLALINYNSVDFGPRAMFSAVLTPAYDDAGRAVIGTRVAMTVNGVVTVDPNPALGDAQYAIGDAFQRMCQKLSKPGQELNIRHDGFCQPYLNIGGTSHLTPDSEFGPKPGPIRWTPIGNTNSAEVVWECEFTIPYCNGDGFFARTKGIRAFNYAASYSINEGGFTTRRISGYVEIMMTRASLNAIPDTVDNYRDQVIVVKPPNFNRTVSWEVSADKRRADFTVTDTEIESPNVYPNGVYKIDARHRGTWSVDDWSIRNVITGTISLTPNQPRQNAWDIFRTIAASRLAYTNGNYFVESIDFDESLFSNQISFSMYYRIQGADYSSILNLTGVFQPIENPDQYARGWQVWSQSMQPMQPFQGVQNADRGWSQLRLSPQGDRLIDPCDTMPMPRINDVPDQLYGLGSAPPIPRAVFTNEKPKASGSYLNFHAQLKSKQQQKTAVSVTLGPNDIAPKKFDPSDTNASLAVQSSNSEIKRFTETYAGNQEFEYSGYAERVGYPIPEPDILQIGTVTLTALPGGAFELVPMGIVYGQPLYEAYWKKRYVVTQSPPALIAGDLNPVRPV